MICNVKQEGLDLHYLAALQIQKIQFEIRNQNFKNGKYTIICNNEIRTTLCAFFLDTPNVNCQN